MSVIAGFTTVGDFPSLLRSNENLSSTSVIFLVFLAGRRLAPEASNPQLPQSGTPSASLGCQPFAESPVNNNF